MWNADLIGYRGSTAFNRAYEGDELVWEKQAPFPKSNEIWYTSTDGNIITPTTAAPVSIVSNTYIDGKGIIKFSGNITSVWDRAFNQRSGLLSITIPDSVKSIETYAFRYCTNLSSITTPGSVTIIKEHAFSYCTGLISVFLSNGIETLEYSAFGNCSNLTSITIPDSVRNIGKQVFYFCRNLKNIYYIGTKAQWNNINKDSNWHSIIPATVVHCSDGDVPI